MQTIVCIVCKLFSSLHKSINQVGQDIMVLGTTRWSTYICISYVCYLSSCQCLHYVHTICDSTSVLIYLSFHIYLVICFSLLSSIFLFLSLSFFFSSVSPLQLMDQSQDTETKFTNVLY